VFTDQQCESALARRPYDLRHACVSTWLNGGVPPTQVAKWAGHTVVVLLRIYASCLEGQDEIAKRRALAWNFGTYLAQMAAESRPQPGTAGHRANGA
jgi:integrase